VFEPTSRYADLPIRQRNLPDGRQVRYVAQRFIPPRSSAGSPAATSPSATSPSTAPWSATLSEIAVSPSERLDLLAARTLGDPGQYWRICDANAILNPATLVLPPGSTLLIPLADTFGGSA
jgi:hypothetical protein